MPLIIREHIALRNKTTLKIGGEARFYAELKTKEDAEEAIAFAHEKKIPLILLGAGSNTIFADGTIDALVVKILADEVIMGAPCHAALSTPSTASPEKLECADGGGIDRTTCISVQTGKYLATLIHELADNDLDLSPLTGIPGTIGGAVFGNAGQGFAGVWIDRYVECVELYCDGTWQTLSKDECGFGYRTSIFKTMSSPIIWSVTLSIPARPKEEIMHEVTRLLQQRIDTQPHIKTAGSVFLSQDADMPAWKLIDAAGLRGHRIGGIEVSEKHANFLINADKATFEDATAMVNHIKQAVSEELHVEMRFVEESGKLAY